MLHIRGLCKQFGEKLLFNDAEVHLGARSRAALIGPNGAGKTTFIKMILGMEVPDEGEISRANRFSIGYLPQEMPSFSADTVLAEVMTLGGRRTELRAAQAEYEAKFEKGGEIDSSDLERYGRILEELDGLDESKLEAEAKRILQGMGFKNSDFGRGLREFSGGWQMRVALAKILLSQPDLLLMDEPTNHLDLESLLWLEEFLQTYRGAMLLISHDRAFLNRLVTEVLEIDQKKIWVYRGNLDSYVVQKEERLKVLRAQYEGQQAKIADIEAFVRRFGAKATKARQAQSRLKILEKMERIEMPDEAASVRFHFPPAPHSGKEVVTVKGAQKSYGDHCVLKNVGFVLTRGSRTALVGVNGAGKTTLLKMIGQKIEPTAGEVRVGHQVQVGFYAQMQAESLDPKKTILQELEMVAPDMAMSKIRGIAGAFLFSGSAVEKKCGVLSGGEKARVALAKLLLSPSNFLVLDEPTNHLDVESRGMLLDALMDYEGTLCLVSHDREFMAPLVDSVLEVVPENGGSRVIQLLGTYDEYLERKVKEAKASLTAMPAEKKAVQAAAPAAEPPRTGPSNNQKRNWEKERAKLEEKITKLEREQHELQTLLADSAIYEDKPRVLSLVERQKVIQHELAESLARWEEVCGFLGA